MSQTLKRLDAIAGVETQDRATRILERVAFVCLLVMAIAAPHSIAVTQTAWLTGMVAWAARLCLKPRPAFRSGWLDIALAAFAGWSVLSAVLSYEPAISLDKLRGVGLFLILYFAYYNLRSMRAVRFVAMALIASSMASVAWTPLERIIGRGVELHGVRADGPLGRLGLKDGDTVLSVNGHTVSSADDLAAAIEASESSEVSYHRPDTTKTVTLTNGDLLQGGTSLERLGIESWKTNRKWRATGFYGHFTTFSEVLQLIGSLILGLLLAGILHLFGALSRVRGTQAISPFAFQRLRVSVVVLSVCFLLIGIAMLFSGTRGSQLGLMASALVMVLAIGSRKLILAMILLAIPVGLGGYYTLLQTRQQDENNEYRKTMWRDGVRLATETPRHILVGVGMDSLKKRWREWGLFDRGNLPMGHFHSTPIQLAAERGMPALLFWLAFLAIYARTMWRAAKLPMETSSLGIILGCLGGAAGFFTAGIVHYNLGDGEVAMVFYLLAGIGLATAAIEGRAEYSA